MNYASNRYLPRYDSLRFFAFLVGTIFLSSISSGCVETRVVSSRWDSLRKIADPKPDPDNPVRRASRQTYAVELGTFTGANRTGEALEFASTARTQGQIADVWSLDRNNLTTVYAGRYPRQDHPEAQAQLRNVRKAKIDGRRAFSKAQLVPILGGQSTRDPNDLRQHSGFRTLVVAVFEPDYGDDFRRVAEATADKLRTEHEVGVYFYHGPNQSLVTAGLFTLRDFVPVNGVDTYGPAIRQMQQRFPHTRRNGELIPAKQPTAEAPYEPTVVVRVP
ncbi:MAG: hypothetical protein AAGH99_10200 [Planctomycetota bacterium]